MRIDKCVCEEEVHTRKHKQFPLAVAAHFIEVEVRQKKHVVFTTVCNPCRSTAVFNNAEKLCYTNIFILNYIFLQFTKNSSL